jgi:hypothetical protein
MWPFDAVDETASSINKLVHYATLALFLLTGLIVIYLIILILS